MKSWGEVALALAVLVLASWLLSHVVAPDGAGPPRLDPTIEAFAR